MDLNYKTINLFPSSIHSLEIKNFNDYKDQLVKETYQEKDEDPTGRKISNYGGWQSNQYNIHKYNSETLKKNNYRFTLWIPTNVRECFYGY